VIGDRAEALAALVRFRATQGDQTHQPADQVGRQFRSQLSSLMNQVAPEHRLDSVGFFDTQPTSPTLERLAGNSGTPGHTAALRVAGMAGLSGASTGFRFPKEWDIAVPAEELGRDGANCSRHL
jgi:hypothetical protein